MKLIVIAMAFVASAAFANDPHATATDKTAAPAHGKAMKKDKAATDHCTKADADAGKCKMEEKKH